MTSFPSQLPPPTVQGYQVSPVDQVIRTDMEIGAPRVRRRTRSRLDRLTVRWVLTDAQMLVFRAWAESDLHAAAGAAWWWATLAFGDGGLRNREVRFVGPWRATPVGGGAYWEVTAELEARGGELTADQVKGALLGLVKENVYPTLVLDFAGDQAVDPRISFSRASIATRVNANGLIETVASNAPRIDYDPITRECLGLLIEESRTNLLEYSEQMDNAAWAKGDTTVTPNVIAAPDGAQTADRIVENTTNNQHYIDNNTSGTFVDGDKYVLSAFVKDSGRRYVALINYFAVGGGAGRYSIFDLQTGTVTASNADSAAIRPYPNGWYRISQVVTVDSAATYPDPLLSRVLLAENGNSVGAYTGDGVSGIYVWGVQLEKGYAPTSYIPTTSAAVTRAAETAGITGAAFSSWYNSTEGTLLVRGMISQSWAVPDATGRVFVGVGDPALALGVSENIRLVRGQSGAGVYGYVDDNGVSQAGMSAGIASAGAMITAAIAARANDFAACLNGGTVATDTSGTMPSPTALSIGSSAYLWNGGTNYLNGHVARVIYWPARLANATLQEITRA